MKKIFKMGWLLLSSGLSAVIFSSCFGVYIVAYDIKRTEWRFFQSNPQLHEAIFMVYILAVVPVSVVRWRRFELQRKARRSAEDLFIEFVRMVSTIVDWKTRMIHSRLPSLKKRSLAKIIHPGEQIQTILRASDVFLRKVYGLSEDDLDIAIKERDPDTGDWHFYQTLRGRMGENVNNFFTKECAANTAFETGRPIFLPSKLEGIRDQKYQIGSYDRETGDGSIFCYPISFQFLQRKRSYVISIVTYGKRLCDPDDCENIKKTKGLLREITRRLELEITLKSMTS